MDLGEDLAAAAIREVYEETGVQSTYHSLLGFRQQHQGSFGRSELYFVARLTPTSSTITADASEIALCRWMPQQEYIATIKSPLNGFVARIVAAHVAAEAQGAKTRTSGGMVCSTLRSIVHHDRTFQFYHIPTSITPPQGFYGS